MSALKGSSEKVFRKKTCNFAHVGGGMQGGGGVAAVVATAGRGRASQRDWESEREVGGREVH